MGDFPPLFAGGLSRFWVPLVCWLTGVGCSPSILIFQGDAPRSPGRGLCPYNPPRREVKGVSPVLIKVGEGRPLAVGPKGLISIGMKGAW